VLASYFSTEPHALLFISAISVVAPRQLKGNDHAASAVFLQLTKTKKCSIESYMYEFDEFTVHRLLKQCCCCYY